MHIWNQLTLSAEQERGYYQMIGNTTQLTFITDPLFNHIDGPCSADAPDKFVLLAMLFLRLHFMCLFNSGIAVILA